MTKKEKVFDPPLGSTLFDRIVINVCHVSKAIDAGFYTAKEVELYLRDHEFYFPSEEMTLHEIQRYIDLVNKIDQE